MPAFTRARKSGSVYDGRDFSSAMAFSASARLPAHALK